MAVKKAVTIKHVAQIAGVSVATVSRYLNANGYVNEETAQIIQKAIKITGYTPSLIARSLRAKQTHVLLLIVPDISNPFYSEIAKELQDIALKNGYLILFVDTNGDKQKEIDALEIARQMSVDGVLFATINGSSEATKIMAEAPYCAVGLNAFEKNMPFDIIVVHHYGGTNLAVEHLIQLGHTDIAFAGGVQGSFIEESRINGYYRAMRKFALKADSELIVETGFSQEEGYRAGKYLLERSQLPTAVCCANDLIAFGVIHAFNEAGIRVPEDVSVTGMDDIPYADISDPPLTTVTNDGKLFAREAFEMLVSRINGDECAARKVEIPNELIVRKSTAIPKR